MKSTRILLTEAIRSSIRESRMALGFSQIRLASRVGVSGATISWIEAGKQLSMAEDLLGLLARELSIGSEQTTALVRVARAPKVSPQFKANLSPICLDRRAELRTARRAVGLSQRVVAPEIGVSFTTFRRWEQGYGDELPKKSLQTLQELLGSKERKPSSYPHKNLWDCAGAIAEWLPSQKTVASLEGLLDQFGCVPSEKNLNTLVQLLQTLGWRRNTLTWVPKGYQAPHRSEEEMVQSDQKVLQVIRSLGGTWSVNAMSKEIGLSLEQTRYTMNRLTALKKLSRYGSSSSTRYIAI